jgi:hypothetical protein
VARVHAQRILGRVSLDQPWVAAGNRNLLRRAQKIATADSRLYKISHVSGTLHSDGELRLIDFQASSMADDDKPNRQRTIARPALTSEPPTD